MSDFSFLPEGIDFRVDCEGDEKKFIDMHYSIFKQDLIDKPTRCENVLVEINNTIGPDGKVNSFWHCATRENGFDQRNINIARIMKIAWIKPLLEAIPHPLIKYWKYKEGSGEIRRYVWAESLNYIIILEEKKSKLFLVTAFIVESWKTNELLKKYSKRIV